MVRDEKLNGGSGVLLFDLLVKVFVKNLKYWETGIE